MANQKLFFFQFSHHLQGHLKHGSSPLAEVFCPVEEGGLFDLFALFIGLISTFKNILGFYLASPSAFQ